MFKKVQDSSGKIDTFIGKNTKLIGKIESNGTIRIDGEIEGDIVAYGNITIGVDGKITGNLAANSIFVSGTVYGNIRCNEHLRLGNTAKVLGDVEVKTLIIDENAIFEGKCKMETMDNENIIEKATNE